MALVSKPFADIITFTRASTATYFDATGTLQSAAIDAPRFDYDPATLAARGFLIEEARTNLLTYSQDFSNVIYNPTNITGVVDAAVAPDGTTTADELVEDGSTGAHGFLGPSNTVTNATVYTVSIFAKVKSGTRNLFIYGQNTAAYSGTNAGAKFNVSGTVISAGTVYGTSTNSVQSIGNGWYRCIVTFPATVASGGGNLRIVLDDGTGTPSSGAASYAGDGTSGFYVWGAQFEASSTTINSGTASGTTTAVVLSAGSATDDIYNGNVLFVNGEYRVITDYVGATKTATVAALTATPSGAYVVTGGSAAFATSYIPTTTSALTRAADVASVNTLSPWFNAAEGTLYAEAVGVNNVGAATRRFVEIGDGSLSNRFITGYSLTTNTRFLVSSGGSVQADVVVSGISAGSLVKIAGAYAANDFQQASNGTLGTNDTSGSLPAVTTMYLGSDYSYAANTTLNGHLRRVTYYPRRLSNAELQTITA